MSRIGLIDSDIVAFKYAAAAENVYYFNGTDEEPAVALRGNNWRKEVNECIEQLANELRLTEVIVCLTDDHNFRKDVWPGYKRNRIGVRKPELLVAVKAYMAKKYRSFIRPGLEADDIMGILATHRRLVPGDKIIISEDKDLKGVPAKVFNPRQGTKLKISELEADRWFFTQTLIGDTTDGYPGCKGIGPKSKFVARLQTATSAEEMWAIVVEGYSSKGLMADDAITQARMARILRASDYDFENRTPILWSPPG